MEETVKMGTGDDAVEVEIFVVKPSNSILKAADRHKSKAWNEAIQDNVLTKKELGAVLKKRGIWDETKEKEEKEITTAIVDLEKELYHGKKGHRKPKLSDGRKLAVEIRKKRNELRTLIGEKIALEENTADNIADNVKFDYIVAHCTFHKDGRPVYNSFEEYNKKSVDDVAFAAASMLGRMLYNLDSDFEKGLPENEFLMKFNLVDKDLNLIDPNCPDHLIDTEGRRINEEGFYLDDDGNRIDRDGNPLTEEGKYVMTAYEDDLVLPVKKSTPKEKKTEKSTTES
jgi:hypothetical protein